MPLKGMIFDLDGTLADTIPVCCAAFRDVMIRQTGTEYSDVEIMARFGPSEEGIFQQLAGDAWRDCLADYLMTYEREHAACAEPFPGVPEMLELLAERALPVAIVTGKGADSAAISLRALGLDRHFTIVESGSPNGSVKPASIRRIVGRWGVDPATVAYVGDAPNDIDEARSAGVIPVAAAWAVTADRAALTAQDPAQLFGSVADLCRWIRHNT
ncbi:MAG: HAD family hydrolase [Vicinamibacterales bacterium]